MIKNSNNVAILINTTVPNYSFFIVIMLWICIHDSIWKKCKKSKISNAMKNMMLETSHYKNVQQSFWIN